MSDLTWSLATVSFCFVFCPPHLTQEEIIYLATLQFSAGLWVPLTTDNNRPGYHCWLQDFFFYLKPVVSSAASLHISKTLWAQRTHRSCFYASLVWRSPSELLQTHCPGTSPYPSSATTNVQSEMQSMSSWEVRALSHLQEMAEQVSTSLNLLFKWWFHCPHPSLLSQNFNSYWRSKQKKVILM